MKAVYSLADCCFYIIEYKSFIICWYYAVLTQLKHNLKKNGPSTTFVVFCPCEDSPSSVPRHWQQVLVIGGEGQLGDSEPVLSEGVHLQPRCSVPEVKENKCSIQNMFGVERWTCHMLMLPERRRCILTHWCYDSLASFVFFKYANNLVKLCHAFHGVLFHGIPVAVTWNMYITLIWVSM